MFLVCTSAVHLSSYKTMTNSDLPWCQHALKLWECCFLCRRKKPAWATTRPSDDEEPHTEVDSHTSAHAESPVSDVASDHHDHTALDGQATKETPSPVSVMLAAFNAAPAAVASEAGNHAAHMPQHSQHVMDHENNDTAHARSSADIESNQEHSRQAQGRAAGNSTAAKVHRQHDHDHTPHHLATNRATLSRMSTVAQEQLVSKMSKARQNSIEKHVALHDMFQGSGSQPVHTVHSPDAVPDSFQEPTLAAILRDSAVADDTARRQAQKAARAHDDALPPFLTTSSSPQSTSRQHVAGNSRPNSRPASAAGTMSQHQFESEMAGSLRSTLRESSLQSSIRQPGHMSNLQSPRSKGSSVRDAYSPYSTGRPGSLSSSLQV